MRLLILFVLGCLFIEVGAQSAQQKFLEAKQSYTAGNFAEAVANFAPLVADPTFGSYATFYLALSKHKLGDDRGALDVLAQLQLKYPAFKQVEEVNFWRSHLSFRLGDRQNAVQYASKLEDEKARTSLYDSHLNEISFSDIRNLVVQFPNDEKLLEKLVFTGVRSQLTDEERVFLAEMVDASKLQFLSSDDLELIRKDRYVIAALLPFMYDGMENSDRVVRNTLVMDLYQGMLLASEWLASEGKPVELFPYDTRKDKTHTNTILHEHHLQHADLIIGPLFPEAIEAVNEFSMTHKVNMINPVTSNTKIFNGNEWAYILKPSYLTMARKAAEYMADGGKKPEVMVYFENKSPEKDIAEEYSLAIQEHGFRVVKFEAVDVAESRRMLAVFTNQREVALRGITDEQAARMRYEGRNIKTKPKFDVNGKAILRPDGTQDVEYTEMVYTYKTDSLDHIFAVTRSNVIASNFIGAVESNPDSVRILGLSDWLDFTMLDYKQLERLRVNLIHPDFINRSSDFYKEVERRFLTQFKRKPSDFHLFGFEVVWWAGHMMHKHGKYFQNGFFDVNDFPSVFYGHEFLPGGNDNQRVPIVEFRNHQLMEVNINRNEQKAE